MGTICYNNANLVKILIILVFLIFIKNIKAQETDPITDAVNKEKQGQEGINMNPNEQRELDRINKKCEITDKEKEIRAKQKSGQKLGLLDKYRIGRANRKDYLYNKEIQEFNKKVLLNRQNEQTRKRMIENEKRIKARDKKVKRDQQRKKFINLFR